MNSNSNRKSYKPVSSKNDPCPPVKEKTYETPPHLYLGFQEPGLEQYKPREALQKGTLWPALFGPYDPPMKTATRKKRGES